MRAQRSLQRVAVTAHRFAPAVTIDVQRVVSRVLRSESHRRSWDVSVAAVSARVIQRLNMRYRRRRYVPDVLSFLLVPPAPKVTGVGEILVCVAQMKHNAAAAAIPWGAHLRRMLIHASLHLLGFHHDDPQQREAMEEREQWHMTAHPAGRTRRRAPRSRISL